MAIKNASDLLVYKKSPADQVQIIEFDFEGEDILIAEAGGGYLIVDNLYDSAGVKVTPITLFVGSNFRDGEHISASIRFAVDGYAPSSPTFGNVSNFDAANHSSTLTITNGYAGDVDAVTLSAGTNTTLDHTKITATVTQDGETNNNYEPIGYSTSATLTTNNELRDITNKDSGGLAQYAPGLKTFEITTDALQDFTQDEDFSRNLNDLQTGDSVFVRFSERFSGGTDIAYAGYVKVTSISMDAGVEENATFSVTFQGTGDIARQEV